MTAIQESVLLLYNTPRESPTGEPAFLESDAGVLEEVGAVAESLARLGAPCRTQGLRYLSDLPGILTASHERIVFNLVEGFHAHPKDANLVPAMCRASGKGCTGNNTPCLITTFDKWQTKKILEAVGLACPSGRIIPAGRDGSAAALPPGTYIVKPVCSSASEGIDSGSVVTSGVALREAVQRIHSRFGQPALVERFVGRRELNVSLLQEGDEVRVLAIAEIDFSAFEPGRPRIVDYAAKWLPETFEYQNTPRMIPAPLSPRQTERVRQAALTAWHTLGCHDYARVDLRLDERGRPVVLELNANPDISPGGGFAAALAWAGISYDRFVATLLHNAQARLERDHQAAYAPGGRPLREVPQVPIRWSRPGDRAAILDLLAETRFFRDDELDVAREVLDDALAQGESGHYQSFVVEHDGAVAGWVCYGPTPCTLGTWDIYWIAVAPHCQSRGLGAALMRHAERLIRGRGGRLAVAETAGRDEYLPTRRFYMNQGYVEASRVRDFYSPGDDKVIYVKTLR